MATKLATGFATLVLLFLMTAWSPSILPVTETAFAQEAIETEEQVQPAPALLTELLEDVTFVWLQSETYAHINAVCAGNGLNNIAPLADGPMVLIPNAGDLSVDGSNVAIKLMPDGEITFIPRTQGQLIRVPMDLGDKVAGQEVLSLSFDEAEQLIAAGKLIWTAKGQGPFGTGHGIPGHIAECDPLYDESLIDVEEEDDES